MSTFWLVYVSCLILINLVGTGYILGMDESKRTLSPKWAYVVSTVINVPVFYLAILACL